MIIGIKNTGRNTKARRTENIQVENILTVFEKLQQADTVPAERRSLQAGGVPGRTGTEEDVHSQSAKCTICFILILLLISYSPA